MASPAQLTLSVNGGDITSPLIISPGTEIVMHVKCWDILYDWIGNPHTRTITISSADGNAVFDIKPPSGSYSGSYASTKTASYQAEGASFYEYDVKIVCTGFDKIIVNDTGVSTTITTRTDTGQEEFTANIPEFPTVALPVAAILGLVFIFGRKKDGL
ncbi:PEF-CTERM sorting domain-containing protein [Methanosarcina sp.]|uniref:PEF-CTERM sorting domain-containing protein n=1 Tax=Methanosarcina sp. TaxID=2213 RepID=UPI002AB989AF|nr:PEF-CTERM sorting domain-containing protein [Methanosarcina sp.]MDY9926294.1 PEF-CTERM sorting domain-containing protein [Methanosarcina sp.]